MGPDLRGVTTARDGAWLRRFIQFPDRVLAEGDPTARALHERFGGVNMPNLRLGPEDVTALLDYLATESGARAPRGAAGPGGPGLAAAHAGAAGASRRER